MSDFQAAIDALQNEVCEQEKHLIETKKLVNALCARAKINPIYADAELQSTASLGAIRSDHFYGQPLATAVREILSMRKAANQGAATVNDIYNVLTAGGFKFETANVENAKRILRISLSKNNQAFHKLPNGTWGLREWYPNIKEPKKNDVEESVVESQPLGKDGEDGVMFKEKAAG